MKNLFQKIIAVMVVFMFCFNVNAQSKLKKVYKHLGVEYGKTRRGDKYVQINYIPKSVPQSQQPEFVKVFYNDDKELQKIGKTLKLKLKESINEQRPMPMDAPNEFVYMDFKKWEARGFMNKSNHFAISLERAYK